MVKKKTDYRDVGPDSLEKVMLEPMSKFPPQSVTAQQLKILRPIGSLSEKLTESVYKDLKKTSWALEVIEKRIENCLTITVDKKSLIFLTLFLEGNVGKLVSYAYYLQYWGKTAGIRHISFDTLVFKVFKYGYPSAEFMESVWGSQKLGGLNLIDIEAAAKSIQFTTP